MYTYINSYNPISDVTTKQIIVKNNDGSVTVFPDIETNDGPERKAYLKWLNEGKTPLPADE
jgi:hypothetical protein